MNSPIQDTEHASQQIPSVTMKDSEKEKSIALAASSGLSRARALIRVKGWYENIISSVFRSCSFLAHRSLQKMQMSLWSKRFQATALGGILICFGGRQAIAYTVVIPSSKAPTSTEAEFIASTTSQYLVQISSNSFFADTYQIILLGPNPNYNPPITMTQLLNEIDKMAAYEATVDSFTFVYGYADGRNDQQALEEGLVGTMGNLCSSATSYTLVNTTTATFNTATCSDVVSTIERQLFNQVGSTVPITEGTFQ